MSQSQSAAQNVKREDGALQITRDATNPPEAVPAPKQTQTDRIQKVIANGSANTLEVEVRSHKKFLEHLKQPLVHMAAQSKDAQHWLQQIEALQKQQVDTPTIIGVVGNTGAGKSSVINAMLEEERLVPTNCMRACTAVVTELSFNTSNNMSEKYRADIEFIHASDWEKDLRISLNELLDGNGRVSKDCTNADSEAGVAYAKIKAVYPYKTKEELASSSVEELMKEPGVRNVLGKTRNITKSNPEAFYRALQTFVDSKEKATKGDKDKSDKKEPRQMEFWPLIKVVRIYTKADALSTGAVIVDLPGVHDSNAARAAVTAGYMKQCTGLFIVAPINRAVDDKAAKSLLGESFKRQLKFDGIYSRITFICSKTDDISIIEASDSLGLEDDMAADWQKIDELEKEQRAIKEQIKELKEFKGVHQELINDSDDALEQWEQFKDQVENGEIVYAPSADLKKRKRSHADGKSRKKARSRHSGSDDDDSEFIGDEDDDADESGTEGSERGDPLTEDDIDKKIAELKVNKKRARREKIEIDAKIKSLNAELKASEDKQAKIDTAMSAICIEGRNKYSKGAIQNDFADGIKELDMENAQEEDPDRFNPDDPLRDYEEVAKSLPVFCVSSRAYQKMQGRLQRDKPVPGFRTPEETEIPQLQAHCKKLTEAGRASNCRAYLSNACQLLNSLNLWASNDGTGLNLTDAQLAAETRYLKMRLQTLEKGLQGAVSVTLKEMNTTLAENIFEKYEGLVESAIQEANTTVGKWHAPVDRFNRPAGGYYWATYRAIVRREGVFSNAQGLHDLNLQLTEPIIKNLATHWEKVFAQKMPRVLHSFCQLLKNLLTSFHRDIEARSMEIGTGAAGMALLALQLQNYNALFVTVSQHMVEVINNLQREANREFTPVIARNLSSAYDWCSAESGSGCFARMKTHMAAHINENKADMFTESCNEVRDRLVAMCRQVEDAMSTRADEIFVAMQRDYLEVVAGTQLPQGGMPRWERKMRADVAQILQDREKTAEKDAELIVEEAKKVADAAMEKDEKEADLESPNDFPAEAPMSKDAQIHGQSRSARSSEQPPKAIKDETTVDGLPPASESMNLS